VLSDKKILITGATGQIGRPIAERLVANNEVWTAARFNDPVLRAELEEQGIKTAAWTIGSTDLSEIPQDFTHVMHSGFMFGEAEIDDAIRVNAEGTGLLMQHCRSAEAFVFVSASAVYQPQEPDHLHAETDPLGGKASYMPTYPIAKIACEGAVRAAARMLDLPTTIARMNVGYGVSSHGGLPVLYHEMMAAEMAIPMPDGYDSWASPISEDDIAEQADGPLFDIASVPTTVINWAGNDAVSHRQLHAYLTELTGLTPVYELTEVNFDSFASDNTRRESLIGPCKVHWKDGVRKVIDRRFPGAIKAG
jgi:UDP-glucuronate 4-epimerase